MFLTLSDLATSTMQCGGENHSLKTTSRTNYVFSAIDLSASTIRGMRIVSVKLIMKHTTVTIQCFKRFSTDHGDWGKNGHAKKIFEGTARDGATKPELGAAGREYGEGKDEHQK